MAVKKLILLFVFSLAINIVKAQCTYTISSTVNNATSCSPCDGSIIINNVTGGQSPYTYNWENGETNSSISGLCATGDNVFLTISDANGCDSIIAFYMTEIISASIVTTASSCEKNNDGGVAINISGASGSTTYSISSSSNSYQQINNSIFNNLFLGFYDYRIEDANGCGLTGYFHVGYDDSNSNFSISTQTNPNLQPCGYACDGSVTASVSSPTGQYTYEWQKSDGSYSVTSQTVSGLCAGDFTLIVTNSGGCQDTAYVAIQNFPQTSSHCGALDGYVYYDVNQNCVYDNGDEPIRDVMVSIEGANNMICYTDINGYYFVGTPSYGSYVVRVENPNTSLITSYCVSSYTSTVNSFSPISTNNFMASISSNCSLSAASHTGSVNPGFASVLNLYIANYSFVPASGQLTYTLPEGLNYVSANPTPLSVSGNSLVWDYTNLSYLNNYSQSFIVNTMAETTLTIGSTLMSTISYDVNCTDVSGYSNPSFHYIFVNGPYDPNHKLVWPSQNGYEGDILLSDIELTYKVEFQNIGTAPAVNVVVIDTLSELLDETSIRQMASSHSNNFIYNSKSRQMQWRFNNINLPDENSNPTGSIGYFTYKVKQNPANVVGDVIKNTAHIYFDFNSAIVTNTTKSTIVEPESVNEYKQNATKNTLFVYPNPSTGIFNLAFNSNSLEKGKLIITDITGKVIVQQDVESKNGNNVLQINSTDFSSGAYFVSIQFQEKELHQKVIIQK